MTRAHAATGLSRSASSTKVEPSDIDRVRQVLGGQRCHRHQCGIDDDRSLGRGVDTTMSARTSSFVAEIRALHAARAQNRQRTIAAAPSTASSWPTSSADVATSGSTSRRSRARCGRAREDNAGTRPGVESELHEQIHFGAGAGVGFVVVAGNVSGIEVLPTRTAHLVERPTGNRPTMIDHNHADSLAPWNVGGAPHAPRPLQSVRPAAGGRQPDQRRGAAPRIISQSEEGLPSLSAVSRVVRSRCRRRTPHGP